MDQFEEMNRKNSRIIKVIIAIPLFFAVAVVAFFLYQLPDFLKLNAAYEAQKQVFMDEDITEDELEGYIVQMEGDGGIIDSDAILSDYGYNANLVSLYIENGDYEKARERLLKVIEYDDCILYHYYLGIIYFESGELDIAKTEIEKFLEYDMDDLYKEGDPYYVFTVTGEMVGAADMLGLVNSRIDLSEMVSYGIISERESREYADMINEGDIAYSENIDIDLAFIKLYTKRGEYGKVVDRARSAIKKGDYFEYHYYIAVAYSQQNKRGLAASEMREYLEGNREIYHEVVSEYGSIVDNKQPYASYNPDADEDGLSDVLEILLSLDPDSKDSDSDGYEDGQEFLSGYNPLKASPGGEMTEQDYQDFNTLVIFSLSTK